MERERATQSRGARCIIREKHRLSPLEEGVRRASPPMGENDQSNFTRYPWPEIAAAAVAREEPRDPHEFRERSRRLIIRLAIWTLDYHVQTDTRSPAKSRQCRQM